LRIASGRGGIDGRDYLLKVVLDDPPLRIRQSYDRDDPFR